MLESFTSANPGEATRPARPGVRAYWAARGKTSFWVTEYFGYSLGSVLAPLCHRAGLSPNTVTVSGFLVAVVAVVTSGHGVIPHPAWSGIFLGGMLLISFGLDCADGTLARITGQCSPFGMLWDKFIDLLSLFVIAAGLGVAARDTPPDVALLARHWEVAFPLLLIWSLAPKALFSVFGWLKDQQLHGMSRSRGPEILTTARRIRRLAGNVIDEPSFRIGLGIAWGTGTYWEFVILYNGLIALLLSGYVADTWRSMRRPALQEEPG